MISDYLWGDETPALVFTKFAKQPQQTNTIDCGLFAFESLIRAGRDFHAFVDALEPLQSDGEYRLELFKQGMHHFAKPSDDTMEHEDESPASKINQTPPEVPLPTRTTKLIRELYEKNTKRRLLESNPGDEHTTNS